MPGSGDSMEASLESEMEMPVWVSGIESVWGRVSFDISEESAGETAGSREGAEKAVREALGEEAVFEVCVSMIAIDPAAKPTASIAAMMKRDFRAVPVRAE